MTNPAAADDPTPTCPQQRNGGSSMSTTTHASAAGARARGLRPLDRVPRRAPIGTGGRPRELPHRSRRDLRARGRVRLRQEHRRALDHAPAPRPGRDHEWLDPGSRAGRPGHGHGRAPDVPVEPGRDGVPVRDERPQPGDDGRRPDRRHLHHAPAPVARPRLGRGPPSCSSWSASTRPACAPIRTSSRAACASGWSSRWRWPCVPAC